MGTAILFAFIAASALPIGGAIGAWCPPSRTVTAGLLAFASGALITAVAFELFDNAVDGGGVYRAGGAFLVGATVFVLVDMWLEGRVRRGPAVGFALLAAVTLDGVPENLALGIGLIESGSIALLVAIFASNLPEAIVGAEKMREAGLTPKQIVLVWSAAGLLLAIPVVAGFGLLEGTSEETLAWPLGFAAGAVLASLADTLMPEAYNEGGPWIAYLTALGFLTSFLVAEL